jgi:adenylyltransferase/sulfurtransferase
MTLSDDELDRYARHLVLRQVGGPGQARIRAAKVLVIGVGGLGSPLALYLAAAGIGTLGLVDDDTVSLSNLQRQILYRTTDVGRAKLDAAADALGALNPGVVVQTHAMRLDAGNAATLVAPYDLVADGSDNFTTRFAVAEACASAKKPLVSAAVSEFGGQLSTFTPWARGLPCYRCLVPQAPEGARPCSEIGILGAAAGVMGSLQALEVLKEIAGFGESLAGRLLIYDALKPALRIVKFPPDPACPHQHS